MGCYQRGRVVRGLVVSGQVDVVPKISHDYEAVRGYQKVWDSLRVIIELFPFLSITLVIVLRKTSFFLNHDARASNAAKLLSTFSQTGPRYFSQ